MNLQGRNLEPNLRGDDVKLLQSELRLLKLKTQIVDQDGFFGSTTFLAVQEFQKSRGLEATGVVDERTATLINEAVGETGAQRFVVRGQVMKANGEPMTGVTVRLLRKGLRKDQPLGQTKINATGEYSIEYQPTETPISILLQALDGNNRVVASSVVICKARPVEIVNLSPDGVSSMPSEFKQLQERLAPIVRREQIRIETLTVPEVQFLACAHQLDEEQLAYLVVSSRMARESNMNEEVFYGLVRQGLPTALVALVAESTDVLQAALETSVSENVIGPHIKEQIPQILRDLQAQVVRLATAQPADDRPTLRTLLDIARISEQRQQAIVTAYLERKGTVAEFWEEMRKQPNASDDEIDTLQYTVGAATITLNHVPLVKELTELRRKGELARNLRDLARFNRDDWSRLVKNVSAPEIFGENKDEREKRYTEFLPRMVEALYPTAVLSHRLAEVDEERFAPALNFLRSNPDFEFRTTRIHEFLREHPDAVRSDDEVNQLHAVQRMMNIAPSFNKANVVALIANDIDSALQIRRMGPVQFVRTHAAALGGAATAEQVYTNAALQSDTSLLMLSQTKFFNPTQPGIIAPHLFGEGVPDLEDLFGSLDLCQCEHCLSVYSPAAYLVDILHFLMNRPARTPGRTALDVLFGDPDNETRRRWDIGEIELTCENTNTSLPHIDLVNEILEQTIAPANAFPFQTESDSDSLGANPEHINTPAYNTLANAVYPWLLPFNLFAAEARAYLAQLGVRRDVLMEHFRREGAAPLPIDVTAEYLGLTPRERSIITGTANEPTRQMWGMSTAEFSQLVSSRSVQVVLERSGLQYEELVQLLAVRLIDPSGNMRVEFAGADCNLATATITNLGNASLGRIHRFVRLQRKLGWPIPEISQTFVTLGITNLNDAALTQLAAVKRIRESVTTPLETILSWWSQRLDTQPNGSQPSLYDRIFNDPTVNPPVVDVFRLNPSRTALQNSSQPIADHVTVVSTALGISAENLVLLFAELPTDRLNLINLTTLYKITTLAKALKISLRDFVDLRALTGADPFAGAASTQNFINLTRAVRESGFDLATLDYLLQHHTSETIDLQATDFTTRLREGLLQIASDHEFATDPTGTRTADSLALIVPGEIVNRAMSLLNGTSQETEAEQTALIDEHFAQFLDSAEAVQQLVNPGTLVEPVQRFDYVLERLLAHLARVASEAFVVEAAAAGLSVSAEISGALLRELVTAPNNPGDPVLTVLLQTVESPEQIAAFHRLSKIATILNALKIAFDNVAFTITRGASLGWLDLNALPLEPQDDSGPRFDQWLATVNLFRAATNFAAENPLFNIFADLDNDLFDREQFLDLLSQHTGWNRDDLDFLTGAQGFDLEYPADFANGQFLLRLKRCFELLTAIGGSAQQVWQWTTPAPNANTARAIKQAVRGKFDDRMDWLTAAKPIRDELRKQQRSALVGHLLHTVRVIIPTFESPRPQIQIGANRPAVEELQIRLNASGATPKLAVDGIFGPKTRAAVIAFQTANDLDADGIVGPLTWGALNQVRQRLRNSNDLYAHFLIDVEMEPCMLTSRIVLATNSVQLFVQRCLLNLEPEVDLSPEDAKEWTWMKNYRVWEANRKVFLYPENWIEPELRDDKSPFFVDLEHGLLQDEVNDATVEREYLKYLRELDRVARLEISGLYRQWEIDRDVLHVVARTYTTPHLYYYRRWVDQQYWTPWELVETDIEGDHLIPVIWNRRLFLFWPMFMEKAVEKVPQNDNTAEKPRRYYEIRLAWSEYRDGNWLPKQISDAVIETPEQSMLTPKTDFSFWSFFRTNGNLLIAFERTNVKKQSVAWQQFELTSPGSAPQVTRRGNVDSGSPPGTNGHYNTFRETNDRALRLVVAASKGDSYGVSLDLDPPNPPTSILYTSEDVIKTSDPILNQTPGRYRLMLAHNERPHRSQASLFYQDDQRTFFIVPSGKYTNGSNGGGGGGLGKLSVELNNDAVPLELPDVLSHQVAIAFASNTLPQPARASGAGFIGNILEPQVSLARSFQPLHWEATRFRFDNFYHPYVNVLIEQLNRFGIEGILRPDPDQEAADRRDLVASLQRQRRRRNFFNNRYRPNDDIVLNVLNLPLSQKRTADPADVFDFDYGAAYSIYNWELFFHAPFMIAKRLGANQRFAESHRWYQYVFDPTDNSPSEDWPERVWQIKPFFEHGQGRSIDKLMLLLKAGDLTPSEQQARQSLRDQIDAWRKSPFNPHLIARMRPEAYMKSIVMAYLDNLIAWGDQLFRQDTRESVNEATQLYLLASEILGERPNEIPAHEGARKTINGEVVNTFNQLRGRLDAFSNALVDLETIIYPMENAGGGGGGGIKDLLGPQELTLNTGDDDEEEDNDLVPDLPLEAQHPQPPNDHVLDLPLAQPVPAILGPTLFFCIPKNDKLLGYWDTVADRLFKIRHCLNIEGVARQLALFAPPIDPGLLVKAAAAGLDIGAVLSDLNAPLPQYRFSILVQKANEFIGDVKSLGGALLSALEKKDAEELSLLHSTHETQVLEAMRELKVRQLAEAEAAKVALEASKRVLEERRTFYETRIEKSFKEQHHLDKLEEAQSYQMQSNAMELVRSALGLLPDFDLGIEGFGSSPTVKARWGGSNILAYMGAIAQAFAMDAQTATHEGGKALTESGYERRQEDWDFQGQQAVAELAQLRKQIDAADIRISLAEDELKNHDLQVANAKSVDEFMRSKYTNQELYGWLILQISAVYFQSYQLARDMASRAERAFQFELGVTNTDFIQPGLWDSLKKGLMAGERLQHGVRRMEAAYLDQDRREYELTKHVSLAMFDPNALLELRETGECFVELPETLFDMDYPGHFNRRLKSVGLTIPCVVGPFSTINCTVTMLSNSVRRSATPSSPYPRNNGDDTRFVDNVAAIQSIATSGAQNDSGLFELNFRDERYLPFEGAGAISRWRIQLPLETNRFDRNSISDVIVHLRYTAREGGDALRAAALPAQTSGARLLSLRHEFATAWHRLLNAAPEAEQLLLLSRMDERFPFRRPGVTLTINRVVMIGRFANAGNYTASVGPLVNNDLNLNPSAALAGLHMASSDIDVDITDALDWTVHIHRAGDPAAHLEPGELEDFFIICLYTMTN